jgi:rubrerythrin
VKQSEAIIPDFEEDEIMTLQDAEIHELETLARHEEAVGELYDTYAEVFPQRNNFWKQLAIEERGHATWLRNMYPHVEDNSVTFDEGRFNVKALETSIRYLKKWALEARDIELINALSIAMDIEGGIIERNYFKVFDSDNEDLKQVFNSLVEACKQHKKRVSDALDEVRRLPQSDVAIG